MNIEGDHFTEATTDYWQQLTQALPPRYQDTPPYRFGYPVRLPDGRFLVLPLRRLPNDDEHCVASLIANQASHSVVDSLADHMADLARELAGDLVVGLPTLGLAFASLVAGRLGHSRYVPLGYSRKFWYDDALSEPVSSITSPEEGKLLRLDPNLLSLLAGRSVVLVDDAISTGKTAVAALRLLQRSGVTVAGMVVAMKQSTRWRAALHEVSSPPPVKSVFGCPVFHRSADGWWPVEESRPEVP